MSERISDARAAVAAIDEMQALARNEDWSAVALTLSELPALVMRVPADDRGAVCLAARACVEDIRKAVLEKCSQTSTQLAAVKAGRRGTDQYQETSQLAQRS